MSRGRASCGIESLCLELMGMAYLEVYVPIYSVSVRGTSGSVQGTTQCKSMGHTWKCVGPCTV